MQENQNAREKEQKDITSKLTGATKDFRDNGVKVHNEFTHILKEKLDKVNTDELANIIGRDIYKVRDENERMLQEVRSSHEEYKKRIKLMYYSFGAMLLIFMLFALIMTIGRDFLVFLHIDYLLQAIAHQIKTSDNIFIVLLLCVVYALPYILGLGGFFIMYEWIRERFRD
ncbi:TPA: DUF334 domain-containing protein [Neisseria gonorrhoeae]